MLGIDFVGPISPHATDGSSYILTIIDYFTKWVEAVPTSDREVSTVSMCLFKVCNTHNTLCFLGIHAYGSSQSNHFRQWRRVLQQAG